MTIRTTSRAALLVLAVLGAWPATGAAQWERVSHQVYLPAAHNWELRNQYPNVDGLFNAFDFGHGILYEVLYSEPNAPVARLEHDIYERLTRRILPNPPRLAMPEAAFMPNYARLAPRAKEMFDWAHILHRQVYDVLADDRVTDKERAVDELVDYYLSRADLAFPVEPKGMAIMDDQYFSKVFRERYPRFNGLIWAYHWLQLAVHEPLLVYDDPEERRAGVNAAVARFWQMLEDPPATLPSEMPMAPAVAPELTRRFPRAAAIFDNLHMMHDVISDILVSELVVDKRAGIYQAVREFNDPGHLAVTNQEWVAMALAHGVGNQGGAAVGLLRPPPSRAPASHEHGGDAQPGDHGDHGGPTPAGPAPEPSGDPHAGHGGGASESPAAMECPCMESHMATGDDHRPCPMMALLSALLADPGIEARIAASPELRVLRDDPMVQKCLAMMREHRR